MQSRLIVFLISLFLITTLFGQDIDRSGFLALPDSGNWEIQIGDSLIFNNTNRIIQLPEGDHFLLIQPVNDKNWLTTVQSKEIYINPAETLAVQLNGKVFDKSLLQKPKSTNLKTIIDMPEYKTGHNNKRKYIRPGLVLTAVAANWTSFYLKRKADDYYEDYRRSSNVSKINKYYDRASSFDVYSSIMLGVSATALTTYLYLLVTD